MAKKRPKTSRAEKVVIVNRLLAQGLTRREVCEELGISYPYISDILNDPDGSKGRARKDSYRDPCPNCGTPMDGSSGKSGRHKPKLCSKCARVKIMASKKWTRERIIAAIQEWEKEHGRPPLATEWAVNKTLRGERYPPLSAVYTYKGQKPNKNNPFGSWAEAIEAAGFPRPKMGRKVMPYGQGRLAKMRTYVVLSKEDEGRWLEQEVDAVTPELAIQKVAYKPGEYFAIPKKLFVVHNVEPKTVFTVMASTPGGSKE